MTARFDAQDPNEPSPTGPPTEGPPSDRPAIPRPAPPRPAPPRPVPPPASPGSAGRGRRPNAAASVHEQPKTAVQDPTSKIPRQPRPAAPAHTPDQPSRAESSPVKSSPVKSSPVKSSPAQSSPAQSSPAESSPSNPDNEPAAKTDAAALGVTGPSDAKPTDAKLTDAEPTNAKPTNGKATSGKATRAEAATGKVTDTSTDTAKAEGVKAEGVKAEGVKAAIPLQGGKPDEPSSTKVAQDPPSDKDRDTRTKGKAVGTGESGRKVDVANGTTAPAGVTEVLEGPGKLEKPIERPPATWDSFAPVPARAPGPVTRVALRTGRVLRFVRHEWTLTVLVGLALAVAINWRALVDPVHTLPQDTWDPSLIAYLIAWDGFALLHFPADLWQINAFFPSAYGLAYSDAFLGYAPFALIGTGAAAAVLRYNIVFILAQALTVIGTYALVRQLGAAKVAAAVAAVAFALAPWRLGQAGHLQVLSTGGIALALAMLARGHGVRWRTWSGRSREPIESAPRPPKRPGWAIAGWLCAAWQVTLGFGIGLVFVYVVLAVTVVGLGWWLIRSRRLPSWWLIAADLGGGLIFAAVCLFMARPYLKVLGYYPEAARTDDWIALYSPPLRGLFTAPDTSLVWGSAHAPARALLSLPGEMALLPGFALVALAAAGLLFSTWRWRVRLALLVGAMVTAILALGTHGPAGGQAGYLLLLHHLPGFDGLRTPGRLIIWTTLFLALLAAGSVGALAVRAGEVAVRRGLPRPTTMARLALLLPLVLVLVEGLGTTPHVTVPTQPAAVAAAAPPLLVLPTEELTDMHVMLWSTDRFADVVNGGSGLVPAELAKTREQVKRFPDADSVDYLRGLGVRTVVVLPELAKGTPWESAATVPIDDLDVTRDVDADAVTFHLNP